MKTLTAFPSKAVVVATAYVIFTVAAFADTCTWTGGTEGRFSAAGNWDRQPVSGRGDALIFPAAGTYENDLGEISVGSVTLSAGGTLTGGAITLTADGDAFVSDGALTVDNPLVFSGGGTERIRLTGSAEKVFNGAIALADGDVVELSAVGTVRFKGGVSGPGATLDLVSAASYYFENKPLAVRRFLHTDGPNYPYAYVYLKAEGNAILERPGIRSMHIWVQTANAFTEDTVLGFADNCYKDAGVASINFNGNSTVADRIQSPVNMNYQDYSKRREGDDIYSKKAMTLTLKGSNDASAYSQMGNELSLIWDPKGDYTQCFIDRTNSMTGSITVKGGCLKMSGTCTFASVPEIEVQNGARFEAAVTNTGALAGLTKLTLKGSGRFMAVPTAEDLFSAATVDVAADINSRIVLPQGTALSVKTAVLGGAVALAAGTYTGIGYGNGNVKECALIEGSGTLTVAAEGAVSGTATVWTGAESAAWENVGNWSDGLPSVEKKSFVHDGVPRQPVIADSSAARIIGDISFGRLFGNSVSVSVSGAADFSGGDFKIGDGATLDIASTGCFTWNAASRGVNYLTETSSIDADGTFRSAGSVDLDMTGRLAVRGLFSATAGRVTIKGSNGYSQMMIERGGRFEATGETVVDVLKTGALDAEDGGEIAFSGKAVLNMPTYWKGIELGSADLTFTDNAQFVNKTDSVIYFCPKAAGESFHLLVRGSAQANLPSVEMKGHKDGSIVEIDYGSENVNSIASIVVGADYGTARLRQRCGELTLGGGLTVSGGFVSSGRDTSADSEVFVTGGKLTIGGSSDYTAFNGLLIGDGPVADAEIRKGGARLVISDGEVSQPKGPILVGSGCIPGQVIMTGGLFHNDSTYNLKSRPVIIGYEGGFGEWIVSNGVFTTAQNVYVGGASGEDVILTDGMKDKGYGTRHDAVGALVVWSSNPSQSCSFQTSGSLIVGQDGTGSLIMGPAGEISAKDVVLTNATASSVSFTLGENGCSCVKASGKLFVSSGTLLKIDASVCRNWKNRIWLLRCAEMSGTFAPERIELNAGGEKNVTLRQTSRGVYLLKEKGLTVVVR